MLVIGKHATSMPGLQMHAQQPLDFFEWHPVELVHTGLAIDLVGAHCLLSSTFMIM
jgi:hypothetical protein